VRYTRVVRLGVVIVVAACGHHESAIPADGVLPDTFACTPSGPQTGPRPWTSGARIRAEVFTADDLCAFAGRWDPILTFECHVDERSAPGFYACPPAVGIFFTDAACMVPGVAVRAPPTTIASSKFATTPRYFDIRQTYAGNTFYSGDAAQCFEQTIDVYYPVRTAVEISADALQLGHVAEHSFEGIAYSALETNEGFSVITEVDGGNEVVDDTTGRLRARWSQNGPVRAYRGLYDSQLGTNCVAAVDDTGTIRCVPDAELQYAFTDASCMQPVVYATLSGVYPRFAPTYGQDLGRPKVVGLLSCGEPMISVFQKAPQHGCALAGSAYTCTNVAVDSMPILTLESE
jgi:hypothetical protein